jgi:hypothetical protein
MTIFGIRGRAMYAPCPELCSRLLRVTQLSYLKKERGEMSRRCLGCSPRKWSQN